MSSGSRGGIPRVVKNTCRRYYTVLPIVPFLSIVTWFTTTLAMLAIKWSDTKSSREETPANLPSHLVRINRLTNASVYRISPPRSAAQFRRVDAVLTVCSFTYSSRVTIPLFPYSCFTQLLVSFVPTSLPLCEIATPGKSMKRTLLLALHPATYMVPLANDIATTPMTDGGLIFWGDALDLGRRTLRTAKELLSGVLRREWVPAMPDDEEVHQATGGSCRFSSRVY